MKPKFKLPNGTAGFHNDAGQWICTGSQMGRPNYIPNDRLTPVKLRLFRLPFVDGCYDRWGAYWGAPANIYIATNRACVDGAYHVGAGQLVEMFIRADSREKAKQQARQTLPNATFYR